MTFMVVRSGEIVGVARQAGVIDNGSLLVDVSQH